MDLIENACALMPRNLTSAAWDQYIGDILPPQGGRLKLGE
jgi:hypothetical protein